MGTGRRLRTPFAAWARRPCRRSWPCSGARLRSPEQCAEVLQDIDSSTSWPIDNPRGPLLEQIYAAGGDDIRQAAEARVDILAPSSTRARVAWVCSGRGRRLPPYLVF